MLILLLVVAWINGLSNRMGSISWQQTIIQSAAMSRQTATNTGEPLYVMLSPGSSVESLWHDKRVSITRLAEGGSGSPQFRGMPTPNPGEYYVSSGLKKIMNAYPKDSLGSRFGEKLLGTIPDEYVTSPDELSVVKGVELAEVRRLESIGASVIELYRIDQKPAIDPVHSSIIIPVLYIGIFILLFPIMLLVSAATRLGGNQREQRYAALRLIGATKAQVRSVMIVESIVASIAGIAVGLLLYVATQPLMLTFKFNGMRFWPHEVAIPTVQVVGIIVATLVFTTALNLWAMRQVQVSPLGIVRRNLRYKRLHWGRLIPLCLGLGIVGFVASPLFDSIQDESGANTALLIFVSIIVMMFGLIVAGPYITQKLAGLIARHTKHAEILLGMKYISLNPRGVFRSVSGVVIVLFVGSFLLACANGMQNFMTESIDSNPYAQLRTDTVLVGNHVGSNSLPGGQEATFRELNYVHSAVEIKQVSYTFAVMSCQTAIEYMTVQCPDGKNYVGVSFNSEVSSSNLYGTTEAEVYEQISHSGPYADVTAVVLNYLVQIDYDNIDKFRSFITTHYARDESVSVLLFDGTSSNTPFIHPVIEEAAEFTRIGIGVTALVAAVSLATSTIGGLLERRRSLITLRLGGMSVSGLKRIIIMESLVPLLGATIISSCLGLAVGFVLMNQLTITVHSVLSVSYILLLGGCIIAALAMIILILPSVGRIVNPENTQTE